MNDSQTPHGDAGQPAGVTVIVPTFNESGNVRELVDRASAALAGRDFEILFVDDSSDDTPQVVEQVAADTGAPVRVIHREHPEGGLGGAVVVGLNSAVHDVCIVMDGDLQHPPETLPVLVDRFDEGDADVVVASRYTGGGTNAGLSDRMRVLVSRGSTAVTKAMFPIRLHNVSDPMTGFFLVDRRAVNVAGLRPRGFKILLEILARQNLRAREVPFAFADRHAGESKASMAQGMRFLTQLAALRFGRMSVFAVVGAVGAVANVAIQAGLQWMGIGYIWAAIAASVLTIIGNFLLIEQFVFRDMRASASSVWSRFAKSFSFNAIEAVVRIYALYLVVSTWHVSSVLTTAVLLVIAFVVRYVFHALVVYAPKRDGVEASTGQ